MTVRARLVLWYVTSVGALGATPYLAVVLGDKGLTDPQIAIFLAVLPAGSLFAAPAWSWLADRSGRASAILTVTTVGATLGLAILAIGSAPLILLAGLSIHAVSRAPQTPIVDALALRAMPDGGQGYGRVRLWGSVAFLVVAFGSGWLYTRWGAGPVVLGAALLSTTILASRLLPEEVERVRRPQVAELVDVFARGSSALLAIACVLHGLGLAFYNSFMSRHVESLGLPGTVTGASIVVAVAAEVAVMAIAPALLARWRPSVLFCVACVGTVPRWMGTALVEDPYILVGLQALHGLSFGLFWVAAVPAFARHASPTVARSSQALLTATAFGLGPLLAAPIAWWVLQSHPPASLYSIGALASAAAALVLLPVALGRRGDA